MFSLCTETDSSEDVAASLQDTNVQPHPAGSMASVMAKILCKNVNSSKSVILAKCKTDREIALRKKAEKGNDNTEREPAKELQTAKVHRDLIVKVCLDAVFCFGFCFE